MRHDVIMPTSTDPMGMHNTTMCVLHTEDCNAKMHAVFQCLNDVYSNANTLH